MDKEYSKRITSMIDHGNLSEKPGWIQLSLHPVLTDNELHYIIDAIEQIARHPEKWQKHYRYDLHTNEYVPLKEDTGLKETLKEWFGE